jgi:RNA polymerase sigma-70 factor (ECF subfamily)
LPIAADHTGPQYPSKILAFDRAIALANTSAEAAHIRMHLDRLMRDSRPRGAKAGK